VSGRQRAIRSTQAALAGADGRHRLRFPLVVRQDGRLDRLGVHVALARPVRRTAVVDNVGHVVCHVVSTSPLPRRHHLALFHAQHPREAVDGHL